MSTTDSAAKAEAKPPVTKAEIKKGLHELGLRPGDNVGVHSSLSSFGHVEGGADAVIDALLETVGPLGTVAVPSYSNNRAEIALTPEDVALGVTSKCRNLPYNPREDSCWTGKIPDTFWRRSNAVRGSHPAHSLSAIGPRAKELAEGRWSKLMELDGYILLLGVTLSCCSAMHLAERRVPLPDHIRKRMTPPKELTERYKMENLSIGFGPYPDFGMMEAPCKERGIMKLTMIGAATVKLLKLRELIDLYAEYLQKDADMFYHA